LLGTGKTRKAWEENSDAYSKDGDAKWFDDYRGETTIIIDEFTGSMKLSRLQKLVDRYPFKAEIKQGYVQVQANKVVVTSNDPPWEMYNGVSPARKKALMWRFKIFKFPGCISTTPPQDSIFTHHTAPTNNI